MFKIEGAVSSIQDFIGKNPLFTFYRIVDAETYNVYEWREEGLIPKDFRCYSIWNRAEACRNCVSRLSTQENRKIVKMDMLGEHVFLVESVPMPNLGPSMALELIEDVTDSLLVNDSNKNLNVMLTDLVRQMNDLVTRDPYTEIYNKRYTEHELCREALEWKEEAPFSIIIFDLDHFKTVNDSYGHLAGDQVLKTFAGLLTNYAERCGGWASRLGGDEFLLFCRNSELEEAASLGRELHQELEGVSFTSGRKVFHVTFSMGAAEYHPEHGGWKELFYQADQAMYRNKEKRG